MFPNNIPQKYDAFIFDLDGTVYRGEKAINGAAETINYLKSIGKKIVFISNKTTGSIKNYYQLLTSFGIETSEDEIINATFVIKKYLIQNFPGSTFYSIGEEIFIKELTEAGLNYSQNPEEIEILIVTLDRTLNYSKLEIAAKVLEKGAKFFAANIDDTCPVEEGEVWDAGTTISALEKRTHRKLENHFGKPSLFMMNVVKEKLKVDSSKILLVGDRLETDIAMGNQYNIDTAHVLSGVKYFPNGNSNIKPVYILNSIFDLIKDKL